MYSVSAAFKQAVYAGGTVVRPMIRFLNDNTFLTGEDIQLNGGLVVTEYFNTEEDLPLVAHLRRNFKLVFLTPRAT